MTWSNLVTAIVSFLGVFSMDDKDFAPLVFFFNIAVVLTTAFVYGCMTDYFVGYLKIKKNGMGMDGRNI